MKSVYWNDCRRLVSDLLADFPRFEIQRFLEPLVMTCAGGLLIAVSGLGFASMGVLISCLFLAHTLLTRVFGIHIDLDPQLFRQYVMSH